MEDALYSAYGQRQISTIFAPNNQYWVILELEPEYQRDANAIVAALRPLAPQHAANSCRSARWRSSPPRWGRFR